MFTRLLLIVLFISDVSFAAGESYSREFDSSDVSSWFFGPAKTTEEKKVMALNIGRIGVRFEPSLNCGKLSFKGSIKGGISDLHDQFKTLSTSLGTMLTDAVNNPGQISVAVICYMQKNLCSHIRNFSASIQRELKFQFNACQAVDNLITGGSSANKKRIKAGAVNTCLGQPRGLNESVHQQMIRCRKETDGKSRNLRAPFSNSVATGEQNVLKSLLSVIGKEENYHILTTLLGETKLALKGDYKLFYPNDFLKPEDFAHNVEVSSRKTSCDLSKLEMIINNQIPSSTDIFSKQLTIVIQDKLPKSIIFDLESLPQADLARACQSLGDSLAALALKKLAAEGRSDLTSALSNDALPKEIRILYQDRSDKTFSALEKRIAANEIRPLTENLAMIHRLAREYRKINSKEASGITARRAINRSNKEECIDQLTCERGNR